MDNSSLENPSVFSSRIDIKVQKTGYEIKKTPTVRKRMLNSNSQSSKAKAINNSNPNSTDNTSQLTLIT